MRMTATVDEGERLDRDHSSIGLTDRRIGVDQERKCDQP